MQQHVFRFNYVQVLFHQKWYLVLFLVIHSSVLIMFPLFIIIVDYLLGMIMWTLIGRFGMSIFMHETSDFFFMKMFVKFTNPVIFLFRPITPGFLLDKLHPLYVAWFFYMIRFYVVPLVLGYSVMGVLSFPLESEIALAIYDIGNFLLTKKE